MNKTLTLATSAIFCIALAAPVFATDAAPAAEPAPAPAPAKEAPAKEAPAKEAPAKEAPAKETKK